MEETVDMKFLGIQIECLHRQKNHIDQMISKLSEARGVVMQVFHISSMNSLKTILHIFSLIKYGIFLGGGVFRPAVERYLLYTTKLSELQ